MCGITGIFSRNNKYVSREIIVKMTNILKHRGPDDERVFVTDYFALGHRRLSIIDIEGGSQPMTNEDGTIIVIFNGEIYNYKELREELINNGHHFKTVSDTEVIVHLYEEKKAEFFSCLNGMFAIAIIDLKQKRIILARDRIGKKPLFYSVNKDFVIFGSEIKALLIHPAVSKDLNFSALYDFFALNYIPGENTILKSVKRILPGSYTVFEQDCEKNKKFWDISNFLKNEQKHIKEGKALEQLDYLLTDAVRLRLRSDVPIGIFLSGGIDSSIVAWKAKELGADLCNYTASFADKSFDESGYAKFVANKLKMDHEIFEIQPDINRYFYSIVYHADDLLADASCLPVYLLSKCAAERVRVVLGGDGGDELFAGYLTYPATLLASKIQRVIGPAWASLGYSLVSLIPVSDRKVSFEYKLKRFMRGLLMPAGLAHFSWNGTWTRGEKSELFSREFLEKVTDKKDTYEELALKYRINPHNPDLLSLECADHSEYLPNDILNKTDRMSMAHGLEIRSPFLDYRIMEWAAGLPVELKLRNNIFKKYLLKKYMQKKFPFRITNRPKQGFSMPVHKWIREGGRKFTEEILSEESLRKVGIFNPQKISTILNRHFKKNAAFGFEIWGLLTFMAWYKIFTTNEFLDFPAAIQKESFLR